MHVCFVIDNCPLTKQIYNVSNSLNGTHSNITILDTIKISIQTMINDLSRNGIPLWQYQKLHLFITSNPYMPISSFQHNHLHFNYQLKEIRSSESITYPVQTLKLVIKHISKFRVLTQAQTLLGYRATSIYEPALIIFFSFGLTIRKIQELQLTNIHKLMRSQYRFIHFRICYPSQSEKDRNFQKFKSEIEASFQHKKLVQFAEKFNRGEHKNIIKYTGKQCLADSLTKSLTTFKPTFCCYFSFDSQIKLQSSQYFMNSELHSQNFMIIDENNICKTELIRTDENYKNFIPFPQQVTFKDHEQGLEQYYIQEITPLHYFVDVSKKLSGSITRIIPFANFTLVNIPSRLVKLQKQLQRLSVNQIYFPVYIINTGLGINKKQKQYFLIGVLHFSCQNKGNNYFELMISFPNFPALQWIVNMITNQKSYADARKIQKILTDYHNSIPQFYHKFIAQYFKYSSEQAPILSMYETISVNNWNNPLNQSVQFKTNLQKQQQLKKFKSEKYLLNLKISQENIIKHTQGRAECCPIYNNLDGYLAYSKSISKFPSAKNTSPTLNDIFDKICDFNKKIGFKSYFSQKLDQKVGPMIRQLDKYTNKFLNIQNVQNTYNNNTYYEQANESVRTSPLGLIPTKKIKPQLIDQQTKQTNISQYIKNTIINDIDAESIMPDKRDKEQQDFSIMSYQNVQDLQIDYLINPNCVAVQNLVKHNDNIPSTDQIISVQRQLLHSKMQLQNNSQILQTIKKKISNQQDNTKISKLEQKNKQIKQFEQNIKVLRYVNKFQLQSSTTMILNNKNIKVHKFEQNLYKLESIGFIKNARQYQGEK